MPFKPPKRTPVQRLAQKRLAGIKRGKNETPRVAAHRAVARKELKGLTHKGTTAAAAWTAEFGSTKTKDPINLNEQKRLRDQQKQRMERHGVYKKKRKAAVKKKKLAATESAWQQVIAPAKPKRKAKKIQKKMTQSERQYRDRRKQEKATKLLRRRTKKDL
jgi:hypothetical protein